MNTRFAVAVHMLAFLHLQDGTPASSELLASSVNTNPSLIRRLLLQLAKAGLVRSQMGTGGGALLARPSAKITLLDVYKAMDEETELFVLHSDPNPKCAVGRNIHSVLKARLDDAERALQMRLAKVTIDQLAGDITTIEARRA